MALTRIVPRRHPGVGLVAAGCIVAAVGLSSSPAAARTASTATTAAGSAAAATTTAAASIARAWDFDGDGRADLAIGVPGEDALAGSFAVLRGTSSGVSTTGVKRFSQDSAGVPGTTEAGDFFGSVLASGDFDADGYADLAVAAPRENSATDVDAGSVTVLYGGPGGLSATGSHLLGRPAVVFGDPDPEQGTFGWELAAADFDGDGYRDLAVGVITGRSGVLLYRGGSSGLRTQPSQALGPGTGLPELGGAFPGDLVAGDLDGNGVSDLAIGWQESAQARGAVAVAYGVRGHGLDLTGSRLRAPQVWTEDSPGVQGVAADLDAFGSAVGIGDVTGDGRKDLVVAVLQSPTGNAQATGGLHVLRGSPAGVTATGDQYVRYDELAGDAIGALGVDLAVGDLDADGIADVAVTRGVDAGSRYGGVLVVEGASGGLAPATARTLTQASPGVGGVRNTAVDYWGDVVRIRDVGRSGTADLLVADPYEPAGGSASGMVNVLWGAAAGVSGTSSAALTQDTPGIPGASEEGDLFGGAR